MKKCEINKRLLPMKMHYFLSSAGLSGVMPFIPVLAKQLGISATGVGIIYTFALFIGLVAKPLFGGLSDHFKKLKWIMAISMFFMIITLFCINFIPPIASPPSYFSIPIFCNGSLHPTDNESRDLNCSVQCGNGSTFWIQTNETAIDRTDCANDKCMATCPSSNCTTSVYLSYNFVVFFVLYVTAYMFNSVVTSLSDAACYEMLGGKSHNYGRQRLWGTVGWGFFSLVGGYLITSVSDPNSSFVDYTPGFYIMLILLLLDMVIIGLTDVRSSERSESILRDVGHLLANVDILLFLLSVFCVGVLTALQWTFLFWYLKELGASPLLLGLSLTVQCFLGELPTFVFSGMLVQKIGHICSISVAFAAYAIRFLWYSVITDAWYVLPVEIMHGATFGLFYTAMTSYAKLMAPAGTEATMQGLVGATFECLGVAVGNLIGGVTFDYYGGRSTYRTAGIVAVVCCLLNLLSHVHNRRRSKRLPSDNTPAPTETENLGIEEKETFLASDL